MSIASWCRARRASTEQLAQESQPSWWRTVGFVLCALPALLVFVVVGFVIGSKRTIWLAERFRRAWHKVWLAYHYDRVTPNAGVDRPTMAGKEDGQ